MHTAYRVTQLLKLSLVVESIKVLLLNVDETNKFFIDNVVICIRNYELLQLL